MGGNGEDARNRNKEREVIFNFSIDRISKDSRKERNLYYKFFAGYYFNPFIKGIEKRITKFYTCLDLGVALDNPDALKRFSVTFDYHLNQALKNTCNGPEVADVLIVDENKRLVTGIEVKFTSNFHTDDDVKNLIDRLGEVAKIWNMDPCPVLLVTKNKLGNAEALRTHSGSNFTKLAGYPECKVLNWDILLDHIEDIQVKQYFEAQIHRTDYNLAKKSVPK
jgi:hypothetical protein